MSNQVKSLRHIRLHPFPSKFQHALNITMSQPLFGEGTNVYKFPSQQHLPVKFGPYTLWLQENKNREVFDTTSTRLVSHPHQSEDCTNNACWPDVSYTYHPQAQEFALRGFTETARPPQQSGTINTLQYQIALKELERQCLETMLLREQMLKNPYTLKFTDNTSTLTDTATICDCEAPKHMDVATTAEGVKELVEMGAQTDFVQFRNDQTDSDNEGPSSPSETDTSDCESLTDMEKSEASDDMVTSETEHKKPSRKSCLKTDKRTTKRRIRFSQ